MLEACYRETQWLGPVTSFDWANAFNTLSRTFLFEEVAANCPSLLPFVNLVYCAHTSVRFFAHHPSGPIDITSAGGVRQGDPTSSALLDGITHAASRQDSTPGTVPACTVSAAAMKGLTLSLIHI